jgi:MoaA/NifB/PqqE/SkfB family radical SAM enzyme
MPKRLHLELTDKCNAMCPMCARTDTNGMTDSALVTNSELTIDDIRKSFTGLKFEHINYCGNLGDPLVARDFMDIVKFFAPMKQTVHTNGSLRNESFFKELAVIPNLTLVFGIDGIDQQSHELYRRGTSLAKILSNARAFNAAGGKSVWQMIVFEHNESTLDRAKDMSLEHGFHTFETLHTRRFYTEPTVTYTYKGEQYQINKAVSSPFDFLDKDKTYDFTITCQAKKQEEIYIDAKGQLWPCCYVYNSPEIIRETSEYNIRTASIEEIIYKEFFDQLEESFADSPPLMCAVTCGISRKNQRTKVINIKPL